MTPDDRIRKLELQCGTILFLSGLNLFLNVVTILAALITVLR